MVENTIFFVEKKNIILLGDNMKKYLFALGLILVSLLIVSIEPTYGLEMEDYQLNINSNNLLEFVKEENIKNITELCTTDFCDYLRSSNIEEALEIFKSKYQKFLQQKTNDETALSTILKGFPITKINTLTD